MPRTYIIYCEPCGYKRIVEDPKAVGLREHPTSPVPGRIPVLDGATKKIKTFEVIPTMPKFRCPACGRAVTLRKSNTPREGPQNAPDHPPA